MMLNWHFSKVVWRITLIAFLLTSLATIQLERADHTLFAAAVDGISPPQDTAQQRIVALLNFVYLMPVNEIANEEELPDDSFTTYFYSIVPVNLIPAQVTLEKHLVYRGPCGAKSRLLAALLEAAGFDARMKALYDANFKAIHAIVEVNVDGIWTPLDATSGAYFLRDDGTFASTDEVSRDTLLFENNIAKFPDFDASYRFDHVLSFTPFYVMFTVGRVAGLWEFEDSARVHDTLTSIFGSHLMEFQFGTPFLFEDPKLIPVTLLGSLFVSTSLSRVVLKKRPLSWAKWFWQQVNRPSQAIKPAVGD